MRNVMFLLFLCLLLLASCSDDDGTTPTPTPDLYTAFGALEQVTVQGYDGDIMEPFISRDGAYLFFNSNGTNKDIFYASYDEAADRFTYIGPISVLNSPAVDGVPTLDDDGRFYYISTLNYPPSGASIFDTIYVGDFEPRSIDIVENLAVVPNLDQETFGHLNFDVEISPDGRRLYFVDGVFSGNAYPDSSDFVYALDTGSGFVRQADSAAVFAAINTTDLEYAACISRDGLEFFFTRLDRQALTTTLWRATRAGLTEPFDPPRQVAGLDGFYEAATLSPDEKRLYFHRLNPATGAFELYRMTRS